MDIIEIITRLPIKRNIIFIYLLFLSAFCFSQQNIPRKIYGQIPNINSTKLYEIQIGAFKDIRNAEKYIAILERNGFIPVYEQYLDFTRVKITGIPAREIRQYLIKVKQMGFDEVIIREDTTKYIIEEEPEEEPEEEIFEEEIEEEVIEEIIEEAVIEETPEPIDRDILCRTWVIVKSDTGKYTEYIMIFSDDGTYLITNTNGESYLANWRWYSDEHEGFEYTHNNWQSYGRVIIQKLNQSSLIFIDPGYNILGYGHSTIGKDAAYELAALDNFHQNASE